jgi:hypothetical protein
MITAAAIFAPTASPDAMTPVQVADAIHATSGADLTPAGWATFVAPTLADVEAAATVATIARTVPMAGGRYIVTLAR